jgi:hypothetical protein
MKAVDHTTPLETEDRTRVERAARARSLEIDRVHRDQHSVR